LQNIIRFVNEGLEIGDEPLRFSHVRNAMLTLVQHGLVVAKRNPTMAEADASRAVPQLYTMDLDEVLSRLRFSHYLEHTLWSHGEVAWHLVSVVLKYGRVARTFMISEVRRVLRDREAEEISTELRRLLEFGLLRPVAPYISISETPASPSAPAAAVDKNMQDDQPLRQGGQKRKLEGQPDTMYTFNRNEFNLCLSKTLMCRIIEERTNTYAATVLAALLTSAAPAPSGNRVEVDFMKLFEVEQTMQDLGYQNTQGQDTIRERERLRNVLDLLSGGRDGREEGLLRRRVESSTTVGGAKEEPAWAVDWSHARKVLMDAVTSHLIRDQFGGEGLRIYNLLNERATPQKVEEGQIFSTCMLPPDKGREVLNSMTRRHIVKWQEVSKTPGGRDVSLFSSFWLYYVERKSVEMALMHDTYQAILNLRIRFRAEHKKTVPLEGRPMSLTRDERIKFAHGCRSQDILERSFLVLDSVVLVFRHFGVG